MSRGLPWVLLVVGAAVSILLYGREQRARGAAEAQGARWKLELDSLAKVARRVDTVHLVRRDTMYRRIARVDTMTVTVDQWKHDTVRVVEYVTRTEAALRACTQADTTCVERVANRDRQLVAWEGRWETREKPPSAFRQWSERIASGLVGYGLGRLAP